MGELEKSAMRLSAGLANANLPEVPLFLTVAPQGPVALVPAVVGGEMKYFPPSPKNHWAVTQEADGAIQVAYDLVISGPLAWSGAAPHINGTVRFTPNSSGGYDYSFERDGFPWAEAYYHDGTGKVQTIFQDPAARGNPYDLFAIEPDLPLQKVFARSVQGRGLGDPVVSRRFFFR